MLKKKKRKKKRVRSIQNFYPIMNRDFIYLPRLVQDLILRSLHEYQTLLISIYLNWVKLAQCHTLGQLRNDWAYSQKLSRRYYTTTSSLQIDNQICRKREIRKELLFTSILE